MKSNGLKDIFTYYMPKEFYSNVEGPLVGVTWLIG